MEKSGTTRGQIDMKNTCPFCIPNEVLRGDILYEDDLWYFVSAEDGELKHGGMIINHEKTY